MKFHKEVTIKAPVEKIFQYLDSPTNLPEVWPSFYQVRDIETLPEGGHRFTYTYKVTNVGNVALSGVVVTDETAVLVEAASSILLDQQERLRSFGRERRDLWTLRNG